MLARLDQLERQLAEERDARLQLERKVTILCEEVAKHPWRSSSALGGQYPGHLFGMPTTSAESLGLPPDSDLQPPSYLSISEYALAEGAMPLDADDGLIAKMMADLKVEPVTNKINQLQEWCMSSARRFPLPGYAITSDLHCWRCKVTVRDLHGELVLAQQGPSAATHKAAKMAAAEQAMRVIVAGKAGSSSASASSSAAQQPRAKMVYMSAKTQLQEWCQSASRRFPLPDYGECRPVPGGAGWECSVQIFDLEAQLVLEASATAATKRDAEMAAAECALNSIQWIGREADESKLRPSEGKRYVPNGYTLRM
ncbi:hypothetical protein T492DRAFT_1147080 [Pavlovales sp. CCMP2436]|nr:hypothetical protein T492DRAFT_1147080 [Pavlovales sp. CCMP2436]